MTHKQDSLFNSGTCTILEHSQIMLHYAQAVFCLFVPDIIRYRAAPPDPLLISVFLPSWCLSTICTFANQPWGIFGRNLLSNITLSQIIVQKQNGNDREISLLLPLDFTRMKLTTKRCMSQLKAWHKSFLGSDSDITTAVNLLKSSIELISDFGSILKNDTIDRPIVISQRNGNCSF